MTATCNYETIQLKITDTWEMQFEMIIPFAIDYSLTICVFLSLFIADRQQQQQQLLQ